MIVIISISNSMNVTTTTIVVVIPAVQRNEVGESASFNCTRIHFHGLSAIQRGAPHNLRANYNQDRTAQEKCWQRVS
jgi:hypothetical protein